MYSIVSLLRAVLDSDSSIISDPSGSECERLSVLHFNFLLHIFSFESIRTVHCFRVIREEGLGAPIQSGWRKGAPRRPYPQQPAKRLAAPPQYTAASEKARSTVSVYRSRRKGAPRRPWGGGDGRPRRRLSPVWRPLRLALPALLVKLIRFRIHDKENSSLGYYLPVLKVCNTVLCPLSNIYYFEFFLIVFSC
jgi:hypothetical protein